MKKLLTCFVIIIILLIQISCDPSSNEAKKYLSELNQCIDGVIQTEDSLINLMNTKMLEGGTSSSVIEEKEQSENLQLNQQIQIVYKNLIDSVDVALQNAVLIDGFDGSEELKMALIEVLETYHQLINNEYQEIISISMIPSVLYTQKDDNKFMQTSSYVDSCIGSSLDTFNLKQKEFLIRYQKK
jgi:hypothetical protein